MDINKMLEIELLYSQYAPLLTAKQKDIFSMYYKEDYSLGEISSILKISRQSVFDSLKRTEKSLRDYEKKLGFVDRSNHIEKELDILEERLKDLKDNVGDLNENFSEISVLIGKIRELVE